MDFSFVHAADLHLDTPFSGIGKLSPHLAAALQDASLEAFDALVELTLSERARFLLLAGDIYDGQQRGLRAQLRVQKGVEKLSRAGIRTLIIHGNHDPLDGWSAVRRWPSGVHCFGSTEVEAISITDGDTCLATVYGMSYPTQHVEENLALRYQRREAPGLHIALLHCNVGGDPEHGAYSPCTLQQLQAVGMDYWALGHIHKRQVLHSGNPWVVYPGNLQGRSPKPSEQGAKGAMVVRVRHGHMEAPEFVALDRVRFVSLDVDIAELEDIPTLARLLQEKANDERQLHGGRHLIIRAHLRGRGDLHADLARQEVVQELLRDLRDEREHETPILWWESLRNDTQRSVDREAIRVRGDFSAELLVLAESLALDPGRLREFGQHHTSLPDRIQRLVEPADEDWAALLAEAETLALSMLE